MSAIRSPHIRAGFNLAEVAFVVVFLLHAAPGYSQTCIPLDIVPNHLSDYMRKVEEETGRRVCVTHSKVAMLSRQTWQPNKTYILVILDPAANITDSDFVEGVAHEITHGKLIYGRSYPAYITLDEASESERKTISLLISLLADVVVNKTIQDEGFEPFPPQYIETTKEETLAALAGRDVYLSRYPDAYFRRRFIGTRYLLAWAYLRYYDLLDDDKDVLTAYLRAAEARFPDEIALANSVQVAMEQHNLFSPDGFRQAVNAAFKAWHLDYLIREEII